MADTAVTIAWVVWVPGPVRVMNWMAPIPDRTARTTKTRAVAITLAEYDVAGQVLSV
jgi:hypothetical protein